MKISGSNIPYDLQAKNLNFFKIAHDAPTTYKSVFILYIEKTLVELSEN